jgi:deoxyribodipyrimidine photo-lyase
MMTAFAPSRAEALARLEAFLPRAGAKYASSRNFDFGPGRRDNVSALSPYVRHRLVLEDEVVTAVLKHHSFNAASKFIQEVCWRTYWKGWLEHRPGLLPLYVADVAGLRVSLEEDAGLAERYNRAVAGETGIEAFDAWARELAAEGYLHNHTRMWFASIWIFTLRLPWQLGADLFFRQLYDGDPASNALSWRWVAGLHTKGKTYLARPDNIETYTNGRFKPDRASLSPRADALPDDGLDAKGAMRVYRERPANGEVTLLVTEEDCCPETLPLDGLSVTAVAGLPPALVYGPDHSPAVVSFKTAAVEQAVQRAASHYGCARVSFDAIKPQDAVTAFCPIGPTRDYLEREGWIGGPSPCAEVVRPWDKAFWPYATAGFFKLKDRIPLTLRTLGMI